MIPAMVADELRATLLDYLDTTFSFQDVAAAEALQRFLTDPKQGIFKGPYLRLQLPFRLAGAGESGKILDIAPPFVPYVHQITAFERLTGKDNHQPQHTLVTTGTGSGKTECFLYPLLDHCHRSFGQTGIKAIILYPMNALASDQEKRFAKTVHEFAALAAELDKLTGMGLNLTHEDFAFDLRFVGPGYGVPSEGGMEAIKLLARKEGIFLDPVYSAKAFHGLIEMARSGELSGRVCFWHTGGSPALFAMA